MKRTISKILGVGLTLAVLTSLMVGASPAAAGTLSLSDDDDIPTVATKNDVLGPVDNDIVDMAVNGDTVYAIINCQAANATYKSTDGGTTWTSLNTNLLALKPTGTYTTAKVPSLVAVAPDDPDVLVIATTDNYLYYSSDGGGSWSTLKQPNAGFTVNDIDVSSLTGGYSYVAAGGAIGGAA